MLCATAGAWGAALAEATTVMLYPLSWPTLNMLTADGDAIRLKPTRLISTATRKIATFAFVFTITSVSFCSLSFLHTLRRGERGKGSIFFQGAVLTCPLFLFILPLMSREEEP